MYNQIFILVFTAFEREIIVSTSWEMGAVSGVCEFGVFEISRNFQRFF